MPMDDNHNAPNAAHLTQDGARHARTHIRCEVLRMHGAESWSSYLEDISATGVRVVRPPHWKGCPDDLYSLDLMFKNDLHIHLDATSARSPRANLGFAF